MIIKTELLIMLFVISQGHESVRPTLNSHRHFQHVGNTHFFSDWIHWDLFLLLRNFS